MKKDLTVGLFHRKDGRYQRKEMIGGVWKTFSANTPAEVWEKIEDAKEEQEEKERIEEERSNAGPLFSEIAKEYIRVVQGMKSGTQKATCLPLSGLLTSLANTTCGKLSLT